jgi:D-alanyl-D-alanine carboxypeptidase
MHEFEFTIERKHVSSKLRVFWITFIAIFVLVTLQTLGIKPPRISLLRPVPAANKPVDVMQTVRPLLQKTPAPTYKLKKQTTFIPQAHAAAVYDSASAYVSANFATGEVYAEKNLSARLPIASITKVMSSVVALDLAKPTDIFTVTTKAANVEPTSIGVVPGEKMTLSELLHAALMTSANDAVEVIRDNIDAKYGDGVFVNAMNEKATFLGLQNSHFANPQGYDDPNHYSSAEDLTTLAYYAMTNYPLIAEIVKKDFVRLPANDMHKQFDLYNWNGLIGVYPNVEGIKIGNTDRAQTTTMVVSERGGEKVIAVVLGAPRIIERDEWAGALLDEGFSKSLNLKPVGVTEEQLRTKYATWQYWQ